MEGTPKKLLTPSERFIDDLYKTHVIAPKKSLENVPQSDVLRRHVLKPTNITKTSPAFAENPVDQSTPKAVGQIVPKNENAKTSPNRSLSPQIIIQKNDNGASPDLPVRNKNEAAFAAENRHHIMSRKLRQSKQVNYKE